MLEANPASYRARGDFPIKFPRSCSIQLSENQKVDAFFPNPICYKVITAGYSQSRSKTEFLMPRDATQACQMLDVCPHIKTSHPASES